MNDIFTNIYNKVLGFFRQTEKEENAKDIACNRLRVVLMQDRTNLTPELMERMRKELVDLLSKYVEMDKEALELNLEQDGDQMALMLSIPVLRARDEEEIEAELAKEDAEKAEAEKSDDEDEKEEEIESEDENVEEDEAAEEESSEDELEDEDENIDEDEASEEVEPAEEVENKEEKSKK